MKKEKFNLRDTIRAYDFKPCVGRGDCYVEGEIVSLEKPECDYHYYLINVTADISCGEVSEQRYSRVGNLVKVPMYTSNDYPGRVINLSRI